MNKLRTLLVLAAVSLAPALAQAQTHAVDQGSVLLDGDITFSSSGSSEADDRITVLSFSPGAQVFAAPGLALGGGLLLGHQSYSGSSTTTYGIGPSVSYYFGASSERAVYPFLSANALYLVSRSEYEYEFDFEGGSSEDSQFGYGASGGVLVMLAKGVGVSGSLYYNVIDYGEDFEGEDLKGNTFGFALGIAAFVF